MKIRYFSCIEMNDQAQYSDRYGIIIQARSGSTRMTDKVMRPFYGEKGILQILIERLLTEAPGLPLIVATTTADEDQRIYDLAIESGAKAFRGSEEDVLKRFVDAANRFGIGNIIRICSDNPFLDVDSIKDLVDHHKQFRTDYLSYETAPGVPAILSHIGIYAEVVRRQALEKEQLLTGDLHVRQHVTYYIYQNANMFDVKFLPAPHESALLAGVRLTVDTSEDFALAQSLYEKYVENSWTTVQLISYIRQSGDIMEKMKKLIDQNPK